MSYNGVYYSELNRFRVQYTATEWTSSGGATATFISIFGVPNEFALERLRIIENGNITILPADNIDIQILSNPALWREAETATPGSGEQYVIAAMDDVVSETAPNTFWLYDDIFDPPLMIRDDLKSNCMHIRLSSDAALSADSIFSFDIYGYKIPQNYETTHSISQIRHSSEDLKILRNDVAGDLWYDLGNTKNPDYNKNCAIDPFVIATDYIYFGQDELWSGLWFHINDKNTTEPITDTWEYWDGSAWQTLTVRDNCTTMGTDTYVFNHSGIIEWDDPGDWVPDTIDNAAMATTEPPYDYPPVIATKWKSRFWVRCNLDDVTTAPTFYWIREKPQV